MRLLKKVLISALLIVMFFAAVGCSNGSGNPVAPPAPEKAVNAESSHYTWGLWQFQVDPATQSLDIVQLRSGNLHLNALPFLEPPALVYLSLETLHINGNTIDADIGLRHPFLGLTEFSGFDVCGILITNGSVTGFSDPALRMAGDGDTRLMNPDGYTRWWNPAEFPVNNGTIFGYTDGLLGAPDSFADYNCTLNGYKYFADVLEDPDEPVDAVTVESRGLFSAGQKNVRHYTIEFSNEGLIFNYAVDASWAFPQGDPPYEVPGDFPPAANRPEAYRIEVNETANSLHPGGGSLGLEITVFDWQGAESNEVTIESPGTFDPATSSVPDSVGEGYAVFNVLATDAYPVTTGEIDVLISVASDETGYGGLLPGEPVTAYFIYKTNVNTDIPVDYNLVLDVVRNGTNMITGIELDWDDTAGISGFNIYRQDPFDTGDDWALLPASPVSESYYVDSDVEGNEAYQYKIVGLVGTSEVSDTSVEAYAILENAEDNVNTNCVWETCAFPIMYNPSYLPQSLFNEFAPLEMTAQNGSFCWDEGGLQNNPAGTPGTYWTGSATLFATPVLPLPDGAETCIADFYIRLNNMWPWWDGNHCGTIVGVTNEVADGPSNPFWPSGQFLDGLDYNVPHIQGFSMYAQDNYTNVDETNDEGHGIQVPAYQDIQWTYSRFALPDVFNKTDARAAFAWACGNSAGGTAITNAGTSFDDIGILVY